jgi:hypothetical protein
MPTQFADVFLHRSAGHQLSAKFLWLVRVAGKEAEEGEVECVVKQAKCYGTKNEKQQTVTLTDAAGKEHIELFTNMNWEATANELRKSAKEKPKIRTFESTASFHPYLLCTYLAHEVFP